MGHAYSRGHSIGQEFVYVPVNKMSHQVFFGQFSRCAYCMCSFFMVIKGVINNGFWVIYGSSISLENGLFLLLFEVLIVLLHYT